MSFTTSRISVTLKLMARIISAGRNGPLPFLVVVACFGLLEVIWDPSQLESFAVGLLLGVAALMATIISLVRLQYFVVRESNPAPDGLLGLWSARETRYLGYAVAIACMVALAGVVLLPMVIPTKFLSEGLGLLGDFLPHQLLGAGLASVFIFPFAYLLSRLWFVFPAAAVGSPCGLSESWNLTKASALNLALVSYFLFLPGWLFEYAAINRKVSGLMLRWAWDFLSMVFLATYVALAYKNAAPASLKRLPDEPGLANT